MRGCVMPAACAASVCELSLLLKQSSRRAALQTADVSETSLREPEGSEAIRIFSTIFVVLEFGMMGTKITRPPFSSTMDRPTTSSTL